MIEQSAQRPTDDELLGYVQGTLGPEVLVKVEAALEADPALAADVAFMGGLKAAVQGEADELTPPGEFGWRKLQAEMDRTDTQAPQRARPWMQYVAAGLACVCVLQGAILWRGTGADQGRFETASATEFEHVLAVSFADELTAPDMRALLNDISGQIVGGPSGSGLYRVAFENAEQAQAALKVLDESALIVLVAEE